MGARLPAGAWLAICVAVFALSRLLLLDRSLWNDEAFTVLHFIDQGLAGIWFGEYIPNNHRLFNTLAWASVHALKRAEWVLRAWSLVPAAIGALLLAAFTFRNVGRAAGCFVALVLATSPLHLELSTRARGYGLCLLASTLLLLGGVACARGRRRRGETLLILSGLIGLLTLPLFLLPFLAQLSALALDRRTRRTALLVGMVVGTISFLAYLPALRELVGAAGTEHGPSFKHVALTDVFVGPTRDLLGSWFGLYRPDRLAGVDALAALALVGIGISMHPSDRSPILTHALAPIAFTYVALWLSGIAVVPRFTAFLLPQLLVALSLGIQAIVDRTRRRLPIRKVALLTAVVIATVGLVRFGALVAAWRERPVENYKWAAQRIRALAPPRVFVNSRYAAGFRFYLGDFPLVFPSDEEMALLCNDSEPLAFIDYRYRPIAPMPDCLRARLRGPIRVPQRAESMEIWENVSDGEAATIPATMAGRP